jgi:hypothetical protein
VWKAKDYYVIAPRNGWWWATSTTFDSSNWWLVVLTLIILGWIKGAAVWLHELKKQHKSYKAAFKDLFFTIR